MFRGKDERNDNLFFEGRDIEEGIFLKEAFSYQETKEAACDGEHMVYGTGLQRKIAPHVEEEGRLKGPQIRSTLMHIAIKEAQVVIAGTEGIS